MDMPPDAASTDARAVEDALAACERALAAGRRVDLRELGFWKAVATVKRRPELVERYADRIGEIDRQAFERAVWPTFPMPLGTAVLGAGAVAGAVLVGASASVPRRWKGPVLLAGTGFLLGTSHDLAHLLVGQAVGIRFSRWFLDGPTRVQPGLKVDYATYLRTPAPARAWMHASGALATKVIPFVLLPVSAGAGAPAWTSAALAGIGVLQVLTDVFFSLRESDWKRFRREMRIAREIAR